jgi:ubiquinone/menaquinone biosynthesis C-methylase UbiE
VSDPRTPGFDPDIAAYYDRAPEEERLGQGAARLEFARTRELILRFAPPPPAVALDMGGGTGPYARWMAELGYEVHLIDPVPRLVDEARRASAGSPHPLASCAAGDARHIERPDQSAGVLLLLGPLYHLPESADRAQALGEAFRVLRAGGTLFAAGISRFASALDGLTRDLLGDPDFAGIIEADLSSGRHRNPTDRLDYFTTAYFHRPEELAREVAAAGFELEGLYGVEGPAWLLQDFVVRAVEAEPALLGASAHLLAVGRRPAAAGGT